MIKQLQVFWKTRFILIIKSWRIHTYPMVFVIVMQWGITTSAYQFSKGRLTIYHYTRRLQLWFFCISMQYIAMIYSTSRFWVNTINVNILEMHYSYVWIISNVDKKDNRSNTLILHNFNNGLSTESICKITVNLPYELHSRLVKNPRRQMSHLFMFVCVLIILISTQKERNFPYLGLWKRKFISLKHVVAY